MALNICVVVVFGWIAKFCTAWVISGILFWASWLSEGIVAFKELRLAVVVPSAWVVVCWHGCLSGTRCTLAYSPADAAVSCFSKIQIGFTFPVPAHPVSPGKGPLNRCMYVCSIAVVVWRCYEFLMLYVLQFWFGASTAAECASATNAKPEH